MNTSVNISVIVPIYGVEKYISRFAVSLLSQSYEGIQFIFVNDGTKDGSMTVLRSLIDERFSHLKDRISRDMQYLTWDIWAYSVHADLPPEEKQELEQLYQKIEMMVNEKFA